MSFNLAIPLLGLCPKKPQIQIKKNICTLTLIAVLLILPKIWKQPKCPLVDEWLKKLCYIYIMDYYAAIKKRRDSYL